MPWWLVLWRKVGRVVSLTYMFRLCLFGDVCISKPKGRFLPVYCVDPLVAKQRYIVYRVSPLGVEDARKFGRRNYLHLFEMKKRKLQKGYQEAGQRPLYFDSPFLVKSPARLGRF